jgi:hypothetical protein
MKRFGSVKILLVLLGMGVSACTARGPYSASPLSTIQWPPTEYKHTISTPAIRQYWNCTRPAPAVMRVEGVAANLWNDQPVGYLEWEVVGVDKDGHAVSSAKVAAQALKVYTNQYTTYQIDLPTTGAEARFDLYYQYQFFDRGHSTMEAALDWDGPVLLAQQNQRNFVLDACSESQHLVQ